MSGQDTVLDHAVEAAKKAVQFDQQGESTIAAYYYEAAVRLLNQAAADLPPDQGESLKQKAIDYSNRAGELKNKTPESKIEEDSAKTESKTRLKQCHFLLQQAIEEDEQGDKDEAIELYAQAVEYGTQYPDLMQGELKTLILQALDRAEELKGLGPRLNNHTSYYSIANSIKAQVVSIKNIISNQFRLFKDIDNF